MIPSHDARHVFAQGLSGLCTCPTRRSAGLLSWTVAPLALPRAVACACSRPKWTLGRIRRSWTARTAPRRWVRFSRERIQFEHLYGTSETLAELVRQLVKMRALATMYRGLEESCADLEEVSELSMSTICRLWTGPRTMYARHVAASRKGHNR